MNSISVRVKIAVSSLAPVLLAACAHDAEQAGQQTEITAIGFELGACFGTCPAFSIDVNSSGEGSYAGRRFVVQEGVHDFSATEQQFADFAARLAPFRPDESIEYGYDNCDVPVYTDAPGVRITWRDAEDEEVSLIWYMGCAQPELMENHDQIYDAWQELPVLHLVGSEEERRNLPLR